MSDLVYDARPKSSTAGSWIKPVNTGLIYDARPKSSTAGSWIKPVDPGLLYDARPKSSTAGSWIKAENNQSTRSTSFVMLPGESSSAAINTPLVEAAASGDSPLDVKQRNAVVGEPIPIVFCRRTGGTGGVLISPPATEARFEDDASSNITASYHLVLSEGQIDSIQVRDVFQRACRVGSFTQTYDRRAGTFTPGNFIDNTPNLEAPTYCGTSGTYDGLSTMAFSSTIPAGFDQWNRQVHVFIRGGIYVPRLLDSVTGPSNNVADLLLYLLRNSSRVPEAMIDTATSFLAAATFTNANGFWFNGVVSESTNLRDWISNTLQYFLLRQARIGGKEALRPLVPTNNDGTIKTTAVSWVFTFTEQHIIPGSFEITYTPLADRKPFCATVLWRQQDDLGIPVMRTAEVRYTGTAADGPYEQHDLSGFCSTENHAVKVGTYILSKRKHVTHRLQIGVKPDGYNPTLAAGDLVRVRLDRIASTGANSVHDYLYEVDRISKTLTGEVQLDLTHFPVDANLASVVAQEVNAATGTGLLLPTGLSGITCDVNSSSDTSVPAETFTTGSFPDYGSNLDGLDEGEDFDDAEPTEDNPEDGLDNQYDPYDSWPEWYPTPDSPEWPPSFPTATEPTEDAGGWVVPVIPTTPDQPWTTFPPSFKTVVGHNGAVRGCMFASNECTVSGVFVAPVTYTITTPGVAAGQHPKSVFAQYLPGTGCGGWGTWTLLYIAYDGSTGSFASAGGCDSNSWVVEPEVEFYWEEL